MSKTILVTGAASFLGSNLIRKLLQRGDNVLATDLSDRFERLKYISEHELLDCDTIYVDLSTDIPSINMELDFVIHLAAWPHVDFSKYYPSVTIKNNLLSLTHMLEFCRVRNIPLIYTSSVEIYGGERDIPCFSETDAPDPASPYSASKLAGEEIVRSYIRNFGQRIATLRMTNLFGPMQLPDRIIPRMMTRSLCGCQTDIEPGYYRDFLNVDDAVRAIEAVLDDCTTMNETFNIASGTSISMKQLAEAISEITRHCCYVEKPCVAAESKRGKYLRIDNTKFIQKTGWRPRQSLKTGLLKTLDWYSQNKSWWENWKDTFLNDRKNDGFLMDCIHNPHLQGEG